MLSSAVATVGGAQWRPAVGFLLAATPPLDRASVRTGGEQ
jgi:hypothetical protein